MKRFYLDFAWIIISCCDHSGHPDISCETLLSQISKIQWLRPVTDITKQWFLFLKLLHWFFAQYVIKIVHKYIVVISVKKRWVYITKDDWCRMQENFVKDRESAGALVPISSVESDPKVSCGVYKFIPSSSGLRALFLLKYNIKERFDDNDVVMRFLQQLYVTYLSKEGMPAVSTCLDNISSFQKSARDRLYYVRCDIQDAFGSIIQEKLYSIIKVYCKQLPTYVPIRTYTKISKKERMFKNKKKKETVQFVNLKKSMNANNIMANKEKPKLIRITKLLPKIKKLIFQQKVKLNDCTYSIRTGVPQGLPVSPILSDIYYHHMIEEIFSVYPSDGSLCTRYVDDILYVTKSERHATEFLELVRDGIPEYNVKFNPSKIETNVGLPDGPMEIKYLGRNIQFRSACVSQ